MNQVVIYNDGKVHLGYYPEKQFHMVYMECAGKVGTVSFPNYVEAATFMRRLNVYSKLKVKVRP